MMRLYFANEPRVKVFDNFSKWIHFEWGETLVVLHHGDRVKTQALYEAVTSETTQRNGAALAIGSCITVISRPSDCDRARRIASGAFGELCPPEPPFSFGLPVQRGLMSLRYTRQVIPGEHSRFKVGIDEVKA